LVLAVFAIGLLYVSPVAGVISTWRESNAAEQRLAELRVENDELKSRSQALKEPAAAIQEARKLGLVAPGEAAYKIEGLGPASP
jgi:cell division protein FtsB